MGRYCSIAQRVSYFGASHPIERAVMSPYFYNRDFAGLDVDDVLRASLGSETMSGLETEHLSCPDALELEMAPW